MLYVNDEKITSGGELNFDPDTYPSAIHCVAFSPINTASLLIVPATDYLKAAIEDLAHSRTAVGVLALGDAEIKAGQKGLKLFPDGSETEAIEFFISTVEERAFCYFRHRPPYPLGRLERHEVVSGEV